jgi:predicted O-linked N-acetylglucosamine transferase (SPINDLY family)
MIPCFRKNLLEIYWNEKPKNKYLSKITNDHSQKTNNSKIKIGYFSGDFKKHAVFHLVQDLFVNHNKKGFEIYAYSTVNIDGPEREKIINNTDKFFDIDNSSDEEIVKLIKSHDLDIAIDLSGYTVHNKSHLFEYNIAKIKINYLGFPGTMGTIKYDYILADKNIILSDHLKYYSEKVIYMPETYQPFTPINFRNY